jgi:cytochrome b involved in lipid metabolism
MGWIRGRGGIKTAIPMSQGILSVPGLTKGASEHVEDISPPGFDIEKLSINPRSKTTTQSKYKFQPLDISDEYLPFIPPEEVSSKRRPGACSGKTSHSEEEKKDYWIVIDNIVYDCTSFTSEHPGGEQVILSFIGEDCSWQFWRFHGKNEMEQFGKKLRIGRTSGIPNRFKEPVRFVGLSKLGSDDW